MKKTTLLFVAINLYIYIINAQINFENRATNLGLGVTCGTTYLGNGVIFFDYDNDGWDDITFATGNGLPIKFFKNNNGVFNEQILNLPSLTYNTKQINWVDFDNDGDKDLYITSDTNGNKLFENDGNMNFQDITSNSGLPISNIFSYGASWGDYNNDSYLDLFILSFDSDKIIPNFLYKNNGDSTFTNVNSLAGISPLGHLSFCAAFLDYNNDGWQDIYISNDRVANPNILYENNGDGTFTDKSIQSRTNIAINAMTVTIGDYNNDNWQDIYVTNSPQGNVFLKNNGDGTFTDIAESSGTLFNGVGWGTVFFDAENDGDLDFYVSGNLDGSTIYASAEFYRNDGNDTFIAPSNDGFLNDNRSSHSNAIGDIDNDGLVDIIVTNSEDQDVFLWKNETVTSNNWLKVNLEGTTSNRDGIGSKIEISINGNKQYRYTHCGEGYLSQNSGTEFFGIGQNSTIDELKVYWLSGIVDILYNINVNQVLKIIEGSTLSLEDFNNELINIWPNPVKDSFTINSSLTIKKVEVFSSLGKKIKTFNYYENIDVSYLNSGLYFIKIYSNKNIITKKIIKK